MNKILYIVLLLMPFAVVSCGGEEPDNPNNNSENHENPGNNNGGGNGDNNETIINYYFNSGAVRISPDAGNVSIYIDSNTEWEITKVEGNVTGFSLSGPTKGSGKVHLEASFSKVPNPNDWNESEYIYFRTKRGTNKNWWYETNYYLITRSGHRTPV